MREKFCRLIAIMLSGVMALSSVVVVNAEGTEAVTTQDAAGQVTDTADTDAHYQEAIGLLSYLGIFQGDEKGDMKPEETITRAEIAAIILREMNITTMSTYNDTFSDVDVSHWAADVIQTAYDNGIINGYEDGTFGPDEDVTYEQAVKMIVCAVNYGTYALAYGEYPSGYMHLADQKDILDHAKGMIGESVSRRTVAKLVYNSLTIDYPVAAGYENNAVTYEIKEGVTILSAKRDIYFKDGIITATPGKSMDLSKELLENQIAIEDEVMLSEIENATDYVAEYSRLFYRDDDGDNVAVYVLPLSSKTETVIFDAEEIDKIVTGYQGGTPNITYYKNNNIKDIDLVNQPVIVYNDQPFTMANFSKLNLSGTTFDEFITPEDGSVRAVDFTKDGDYDILFIENYETSVVKLATTKRIQLEYPLSIAPYGMVELDTQENDNLLVNIIRDGEKCELKDLKAGDIVSVRANANFADSSYTGTKSITIEATLDYVDGTVKSVSDDNGDYYAVIDDTEYRVLNNSAVVNDVRNAMGSKGKFYFNKFGTISFVEGATTNGLSSGEKYGWIVNVYASNSGKEFYSRLYTSDGEMVDLPIAGTVDFWASDAQTNRQATASEINALLGNSASGFLECAATDVSGKVSMRICKFRTNSKGEIMKLYLAVDSAVVSDTRAVRVVTKDHKESVTRGGLFDGKYYIQEGVSQMTVPLSLDGVRDIANYGYRIASTSEFTATAGEEGLGYNCFFVNVEDAAPGLMIKMMKSVTEAMDISEYVTADDNPVILISSIATAVDDNDEEVYIIKGYREGTEVSYTTARNVLVAQVNETPRLDKTSYATTTIWTKDSDVKLTDVLHPGDICGIDGSASSAGIILRMVDTTGLAKHLSGGGTPGTVQAGQFKYDEMFSPTRDRVIFGNVTDIRTTPIVQYDIAVNGSDSTSTDEDDVTTTGATTITAGITNIDRPVQFVYISSAGRITVDKFVSDTYEVEIGDYVFMRNFKNDAARELYVIRYE